MVYDGGIIRCFRRMWGGRNKQNRLVWMVRRFPVSCLLLLLWNEIKRWPPLFDLKPAPKKPTRNDFRNFGIHSNIHFEIHLDGLHAWPIPFSCLLYAFSVTRLNLIYLKSFEMIWGFEKTQFILPEKYNTNDNGQLPVHFADLDIGVITFTPDFFPLRKQWFKNDHNKPVPQFSRN